MGMPGGLTNKMKSGKLIWNKMLISSKYRIMFPRNYLLKFENLIIIIHMKIVNTVHITTFAEFFRNQSTTFVNATCIPV